MSVYDSMICTECGWTGDIWDCRPLPGQDYQTDCCPECGSLDVEDQDEVSPTVPQATWRDLRLFETEHKCPNCDGPIKVGKSIIAVEAGYNVEVYYAVCLRDSDDVDFCFFIAREDRETMALSLAWHCAPGNNLKE